MKLLKGKELRLAKARSARITRVYGERCSGIQINIMDIGKVFANGEGAIAANPLISDQALGDDLAAFVETIRRN